MVICKYFQTGNCRFGSKCVNEHLDIKQIIKSEVEAAVKGSQWPLSSFGPFKEKACIPNFIEDQSFEEVRYLGYEAKRLNCIPQYQQQFNQQIQDAQNKMKHLLSFSPEVLNIITQIYESGAEPNKAISPTVNNPFSTMGGNPSNTSNLFGNNQIQSNPFAKSTSVSFVGGTTPGTSHNVFGTNAPTSNQGNLPNNNIFGNNSSQSSIFGGAVQQSQTQPQTNPFGGAFPSQQSANIFAGQSQQQANPVFGGNVNQSNFQQNQSFGNIFGSNNTATNSGIFSTSNQPQQPNLFQQTNSANIFSQTPIIQQPFAQPNQTQNSGFSNQTSQNKSFTFSSFLQNSNQQSQSQPQAFSQQPTNQGIFATNQQPNQNMFAQAVQQPEQTSQQSNSQQNLFGQTIQSQPFQPQPFSQSVQPQQQSQTQFFNTQQSQVAKTTPTNTNSAENSSQNIFAQAAASIKQENSQMNNQQQFGMLAGANQQINQNQVPPGVYSKLESLSSEALEAFKADYFVIGKIPTVPPPKELCF